MFRRDYIMDQIEKFTVMLHKILFQKEQKQFGEAERLMSEACRHLFGLNLKSLKALSTRDILELLSYHGATDIGKAIVLTDMLREQGALQAAADEPDEAYESWLKALDIVLEVFLLDLKEGKELSEELVPRVEQLLSLIGKRGITVEVMRKLLTYYEDISNYAKVEDTFYYLLEDDPDRAGTTAAGLLFYERLLLLEPDRLGDGGFSLQEAEEGLLEWKRRAIGANGSK